MIYECSGLPGSGKSTLVEELSNQLRKDNKKVKQIGTDSFWAVKNNNKIMKTIIKVGRILQPLKPTNWKFSLICMQFFFKRTKPANVFSSYSSNYETFIAVLYCIYLFDEYRRSDDVIVSDEGLLQALTSLSLKSDSGLEEIINLVHMKQYIKTTSLQIHCKLSIDETINRLKLRNRTTSNFDQISGTNLSRYLEQHKSRLEFLITEDTFSKKIEVDMNEPTENVVQYILKKGGKIV